MLVNILFVLFEFLTLKLNHQNSMGAATSACLLSGKKTEGKLFFSQGTNIDVFFLKVGCNLGCKLFRPVCE